MTPIDALIELLGRLGASQGAAILVNDEDLKQWPAEAVKAMKKQKLIVKSHPAASAICPGCERSCAMMLHTLLVAGGAPSFFVVCDKRSDINRVPIPNERLNQWQCNVNLVTGFVVAILGLRSRDKQTAMDGLLEIGIITGKKRSQMLCLQAIEELTLVAGSSKLPLTESVEFQNGSYLIDEATIHNLADASTTADNRYTPSDVKREANKLETQKQYQAWQKAYRALKHKKPGKSDVWYSLQIAKNDNPNNRNAETIRKHMKK